VQHRDCASQYPDAADNMESDMASFDLVSFVAVAFVVGGLAAVLWEILAKSPGSLLEMATDSRRFAEPALTSDSTPAVGRAAELARPAANRNDRPRLAA
jgi:hypothetical protein